MEKRCGVYVECPDLVRREVEEPCEFDGQELIYVSTKEIHYAMTIDAAENMAACINYLCDKKPSDYTKQEPPQRRLRGALYVMLGTCYVGSMVLLVKWLLSLM